VEIKRKLAEGSKRYETGSASWDGDSSWEYGQQ
jgi:hypothetical protein